MSPGTWSSLRPLPASLFSVQLPTSSIPSSRHVFTLGLLKGYRLMYLFRFKIWWMIPGFGKSGRDVPMETQMLLLEAREDEDGALVDDHDPSAADTLYVLFLPVLDGQFRSCLQVTANDQLQFCVDSGDVNVQTSQVKESVLVNYGDNPYQLNKDSIKNWRSTWGLSIILRTRRLVRLVHLGCLLQSGQPTRH